VFLILTLSCQYFFYNNKYKEYSILIMKGCFILITLYIIYTPQNLIKQAKNLSYPQPLYIVYIKITNTIYSIYKNNLIKIHKINNFSNY
jgi:hypothetical protein